MFGRHLLHNDLEQAVDEHTRLVPFSQRDVDESVSEYLAVFVEQTDALGHHGFAAAWVADNGHQSAVAIVDQPNQLTHFFPPAKHAVDLRHFQLEHGLFGQAKVLDGSPAKGPDVVALVLAFLPVQLHLLVVLLSTHGLVAVPFSQQDEVAEVFSDFDIVVVFDVVLSLEKGIAHLVFLAKQQEVKLPCELNARFVRNFFIFSHAHHVLHSGISENNPCPF